MIDKTRENYYRRMAKRLGLELKKSSAKKLSVSNRGGYRLIDAATGDIRAGKWWELTFDEVIKQLDSEEGHFMSTVDAGRKAIERSNNNGGTDN